MAEAKAKLQKEDAMMEEARALEAAQDKQVADAQKEFEQIKTEVATAMEKEQEAAKKWADMKAKKSRGDRNSRFQTERTPRGSEKVGYARGYCFEPRKDEGARREEKAGDGGGGSSEELVAGTEAKAEGGIGRNKKAVEGAERKNK